MNLLKELEVGRNPPEIVNAVIEIPKGSRNKYEYDPKIDSFRLSRVLYSPFHYDADYGVIPQTLCEDGDFMDIMVLTGEPTFPGCIIEARPIGLLKMLDNEKSDDKILAVPVMDPRFNDVKDISKVSQHILKEIAHFFEVYKVLEVKKTQVIGWEDAESAKKAIMHAAESYRRNKGV